MSKEQEIVVIKGIDFDACIKLQEASIGNDPMLIIKHIFE